MDNVKSLLVLIAKENDVSLTIEGDEKYLRIGLATAAENQIELKHSILLVANYLLKEAGNKEAAKLVMKEVKKMTPPKK